MNALVDHIVAFLVRNGIAVREQVLDDASFLPGVGIVAGEVVVDRAQLEWPGDLLHEAGHIAITPAARRHLLPESLDGLDVLAAGGEAEATAWAYAATVALGLDPQVLFHEGGYHGRSASLAMTFSFGVYPGSKGLIDSGMALSALQALETGQAAYPHMQRWLHD